MMCFSAAIWHVVFVAVAQMITQANPSKVTFLVTQLQSVPLSQAVNLCSPKPASLYPCLCKACRQTDVIKHLLKVSHSPMDIPLSEMCVLLQLRSEVYIHSG